MSRLRRVAGVCGLAWRRFRTRALRTAPRRTAASVVGVAVAIVLLLVVTGLAVGMAAPATGLGGEEYWIVPESSGASSPLVATGDPQFGEAHAATERIRAIDGVDAASPLLVEVLRFESESGEREYLVAAGVIAGDGGGGSGAGGGGSGAGGGGSGAGGDGGAGGAGSAGAASVAGSGSVDVLGVSTAPLTAGDPHFADGGYDGEWTGEVVLSNGASQLLEAEAGDRVGVVGQDDREFAVTAVDEGGGGPSGATPVAVMQLSELQAITGADGYDGADQFVVEASDERAVADLEGIYEGASVRSGAEMATQQFFDDDLAVALGVAALLVAIVVGSLFVASTMAMEVAADRAQLSTLAAIGVGRRTRVGLYAAQSLLVVTIGGLVGVLGGFGGIRLANAVAAAAFDVDGLLVSHPLLAGYGIVAAWLVGLLSIPLLVVVVRRVEGADGVSVRE